MKSALDNLVEQQTLPTTLDRARLHKPKFVLEYFDDSASTKLKDIVGRRSAGNGFLRAILDDTSVHQPAIAVASETEKAALKASIEQLGYDSSIVDIIYMGDLLATAKFGCSFGMDPELGDRLWRRRLVDERSYSIVGSTHSLVSKNINKLIADLVVEPVQPWDAMICTSKSAVTVVSNVIENYREYLRRRGVHSPPPPIKLPIIPLGIHTEDFAQHRLMPSSASAFRERLGIGESDIMLLSFGRIDPYNKSHPAPLIQAVQLAQEQLDKQTSLHLVMVGQTPNEQIETDVKKAISTLAPGTAIHKVDGASIDASCHCWHAADIFISLSDNLQETFGLTPIEAMAAGLPLIVSDWNGYRDTVSSEEFGIRIPTFMPDIDSSIGRYFADRHAANIDNYTGYVGSMAQMSPIDIGAASRAIAELASNPERRRRMGKAAKRHAIAHYDWPVIMNQYYELVDELNVLRSKSKGIALRNPEQETAMVTVPDALRIFADHPSLRLNLSTRVTMGCWRDDNLIDWLLVQSDTGFVNHALMPQRQIKALLEKVGSEPVRVRKLCKMFSDQSHLQVIATCAWLAKYGLLKLVSS